MSWGHLLLMKKNKADRGVKKSNKRPPGKARVACISDQKKGDPMRKNEGTVQNPTRVNGPGRLAATRGEVKNQKKRGIMKSGKGEKSGEVGRRGWPWVRKHRGQRRFPSEGKLSGEREEVMEGKIRKHV